ncbi:hypothetical protein [Haloplanus natans]|uniref:hypothetical protein n=1 Tax=Haloplanus natans TaxID=376171 RepID=UPI000678270F|nr:hypothetical protein [Haloplanus natans]
MEESLRQTLHQFPYPRGKDQHKALANYFEAKKTQSKTQAAETADINHRTATKFENVYKDLTEQEKIKLDQFLLKKKIERSDQVEADEEGLTV